MKNSSSSQNNPIQILFLTTLLFFAGLGFGIFVEYKFFAIQADKHVTDGIIKGEYWGKPRISLSDKKSKYVYMPIVLYIDHNGNVQEFIDNDSGGPQGVYQKGQKVKVIYTIQSNGNVLVMLDADIQKHLMIFGIFLAIALMPLIAGIQVYLRENRPSKKV